jgi:hypothetical protein
MLTGRERMRRALAGACSLDHVPLWEIEFHKWDHYAGRPLVLGYEFARLSAADQEQALQSNAKIMVEVAYRLGHSAITCPGGYWEAAPGLPAYYWLPEEASWRQLRVLRAAAGDELALVMFTDGVIMPPPGAGYEEFCYRLHDAPQEIDAQAARSLSAGIEQAKRARDLGADVVGVAADIADNHGVFFSPKHLARFWMPYLCRWAAAVREMGLYSLLHSDGNLNTILEQLAGSGLHGLQAIDPIAGMDIAAVKAAVGDRLCLCGNVDCALLHSGPPEAVGAQTANLCRVAKPGGRFVLGASNAVFTEIPASHYEAMLAAWGEHGGY